MLHEQKLKDIGCAYFVGKGVTCISTFLIMVLMLIHCNSLLARVMVCRSKKKRVLKKQLLTTIRLSDYQSEELENVTEQACVLVDDFEKELDAMWHNVHDMLTCEMEDCDLQDDEAFPDEGDFDVVDIVEELTFAESNQHGD